ncbi:hypothetical protein BLOT_003942 [Blomia tropicalis]|nr:hypothetical protein BLOT_003942 [Blomia tropicalis]
MHSANAILARSQFQSGPKIVTSYLNDITFNRCTLHHLLLEQLESWRSTSQKIFDHETQQSFTYGELAQLIRKSATAFSEQFLIPGDYVLFVGTNCIEYLALYFGAISIGAIPISLPQTNISLLNIMTQIIQHNIQILVFASNLDSIWITKLINSISNITKIVIYNQNVKSHTSNKVITFFDFIQNANIESIQTENLNQPKNLNLSICTSVCSSGSNEWPPKIYLYGHQSLVAAIEILCHSAVLDYRSIDRLLVYGSFEHLESFLMFLCGIFFGCNIILLPTYRLETIVQSIQLHRINLAWFSSITIHRLLNENKKFSLRNLTKLITFGGKISKELCTEFLLKYTNVKSFRHCYLMAESPIPISMMILNSHDYNSVGFVLPNTRVKILQNPLDQHSMNEINRVGFICIEREPELFAIGCLHNNQQIVPLCFETSLDDNMTSIVSSIILNSSDNKNIRRWLPTQDIGYYDEEGLIYNFGKWVPSLKPVASIQARIQENEIESIILSHPKVDEVALIFKLDHSWAAMVVSKHFSTSKQSELVKEINEFIKENVKTNSMLSQTLVNVSNIFIKNSLIKTSTGRIVRALVRNEVQNLLNVKRKF